MDRAEVEEGLLNAELAVESGESVAPAGEEFVGDLAPVVAVEVVDVVG